MKTRVLSAVVGIILLIIVLNFFETPILNIAIMVIALIAMHEFLTATTDCCRQWPILWRQYFRTFR